MENINLIQDGVFYFHPKLQLVPPPPVKETGEDGRLRKKQESKFTLKIRPSLTYEEILRWIYREFPYLIPNFKRDTSSLNYIYKGEMQSIINMTKDSRMNALDLLLFTIEAAKTISEEDGRPISSAIELNRYIRDGLETYIGKKNSAVESDLDHVI